MKQELFKEMYNNIHLDNKQKERILSCLEQENHRVQAKPQKRFHIPAIAICACIVLLAAVPVFAANTPVLDRIAQAFNLLSTDEVELTEQQKNIYSKYGNILDNEIKLDNCTIKLEAVICDKNYICIPFSLIPADETVTVGKDIYGSSLYKIIQKESGNLKFCKKDTNDWMGLYTILPSEIQNDGTLKGCYLMSDPGGALNPGDTMYIKLPDKQDSSKLSKVLSKFKINKIAKGQNIPVDKKVLQAQGLYPINNMEISPLSLRIEYNNNPAKGKRGFMSNLFFYDITVELKDGTVVKKIDTGSGGSSTTNTCITNILFESPVNIDDVGGVRIESKDFNLWFPIEE